MNNDRDIISRVLHGDKRAFSVLVEAHQSLVWHMVARVVQEEQDREDVCQEVFMKVFKYLKDFNHQSKLSTWIASIAYRTALNHAKKQQQKQALFSPGDKRLAQVPEETSKNTVEKRDRNQFIQQQIQQLPVPYRTVLTLFHLEEMNYAEIVEVTGMPEGTVKSYLFRARKQLKEKLQHVFCKEELL